jgi:CRISPR/Cas system CSM-associated protein Csm5 (group 7 of RAMP superfamily)
MNEQNTFYIKILSPVHIGCDEVYEPAGFIVNEQTEHLPPLIPLISSENWTIKIKTVMPKYAEKAPLNPLRNFISS